MKTKEEKNGVGEPLCVFHVCCAFGSRPETVCFPTLVQMPPPVLFLLRFPMRYSVMSLSGCCCCTLL